MNTNQKLAAVGLVLFATVSSIAAYPDVPPESYGSAAQKLIDANDWSSFEALIKATLGLKGAALAGDSSRYVFLGPALVDERHCWLSS